MSQDKEIKVMISKAPEDPEEKKAWVNQMFRIQVAMWIGDATCEHCGYTYKSVDDFIRCNPHNGHTEKMSFVCAVCYPEYAKLHPIRSVEQDG